MDFSANGELIAEHWNLLAAALQKTLGLSGTAHQWARSPSSPHDLWKRGLTDKTSSTRWGLPDQHRIAYDISLNSGSSREAGATSTVDSTFLLETSRSR